MIRVFCAILALMLLSLTGCEAAPKEEILGQPAYFVPSAMMAGTPSVAYQILPAGEAEDYFIGRAEKFVYGSYSLSAYSAYTLYTYDAQQISSPWGVGYRYTYSIKTGESSP